MKIKTIALFVGYLFMTSFLTGCGDKFQEEYPWIIGKQEDQSNEDEEGAGATDIKVLEKELRGAIPFMINYSHEPTGSWQPHKYQYYRSNNIDNYAGYWTTSKGNFAFGPALHFLYTFPNGYMGGPSDNQIFTQSKNAIFHAETLGKPEWRAVALIIQAYAAHEIVDFYGAMPFNDWRNVNRIPPLKYDKGSDVYNQIFLDLDEAIAILKERKPSSEEIAKIEDPLLKTFTQGKWQNWVKFANCIKLRMAMNIVDYDQAMAQQKAEEAVNDDIGVLTENDSRDLAYYMEDYNASNVWWFMGNMWHDIRLGASFENILKHFNHPLLSRWFDTSAYAIKDKNTGVQAVPDIYGMRCGLNMSSTNTTGKDKGNYGPFATLTNEYQYMAQPFFKRVEVLFLRAEGALRGWAMGGEAKEFYEAGIRLSLTDDGVNGNEPLSAEMIDTYINQTAADVRKVDYIDPYNQENNIAGRVAIDVKWDEADSKELKLEKIITQKYIANFPMGAEAWTTFRRTGYPRLFPPKVNSSDVDTELQIRRIPIEETSNNTLEIASLVEALGAPNSAATRVFWDKENEERGAKSDDNDFLLVIPKNF